ncbi:winged helix DNA-binding domain-containing protein [Streptomyces antibioticus]|uniref:winged helix DNA-binding domain-containing protein n=1 Tax=Streptomyces antibioticus TaxID=1890 RepID=UPI0036DA3B88
MSVLTQRDLNRATLARPFLLEREDCTVLDAVSHLAGLQAQAPQEPFTGLWSRVGAFTPTELDSLVTGRQVVRTHLMRRTVHLVTATDVLAWRARHDAMLRQRVLSTYRSEPAGIDLDELSTAGLAVMADDQPRTTGELVGALRDRWPTPPSRVLGELLVAALIPMAQLPPRGRWKKTAGVRNLFLSTWLHQPVPQPPADPGDPIGQQLVLRYLTAYGPATTADIRAWSGLAGLPAAVKALRGDLLTYRDERGRLLLDLPDAPRPHADTPAPVRFLPAFDNAILGYQDRSRIIDDPHLGISVAGQRAALVDGRVAAAWTTSDRRLTISPPAHPHPARRARTGDRGPEPGHLHGPAHRHDPNRRIRLTRSTLPAGVPQPNAARFSPLTRATRGYGDIVAQLNSIESTLDLIASA